MNFTIGTKGPRYSSLMCPSFRAHFRAGEEIFVDYGYPRKPIDHEEGWLDWYYEARDEYERREKKKLRKNKKNKKQTKKKSKRN